MGCELTPTAGSTPQRKCSWQGAWSNLAHSSVTNRSIAMVLPNSLSVPRCGGKSVQNGVDGRTHRDAAAELHVLHTCFLQLLEVFFPARDLSDVQDLCE